MQEQRRYMRTSSEALVEITHPSIGIMELKAKDLSDGGLFVFLGSHIGPPVGTVVKARIKRHTGLINVDPVDMQVVHHLSGGMGLMFIKGSFGE
jgi:hypothetical protein